MRAKIWADVELVTSDACTYGDDVQRQFRESLPLGKKRFVSFVLPIGWLWVRRLSNYCFFFFLSFCCCLFLLFNVPSSEVSLFLFFSFLAFRQPQRVPSLYPSVNRQLFPDFLFVGWLSVALRPQ